LRYAWPGNVRELENALFSAMILAPDGRLRPEDLPEPARNATPGVDLRAAKAETGTVDFDHTIGELERSLLQRALTTAAGNKSEAARLLQLSRKRFTYKLRQYELE
jgi:DNA-binding NtrC family response regulator